MSLLRRIGAHAGAVDALVVSPRGEIVTAGRDGLVIAWSAERARLLHRSEADWHAVHVHRLAVAPSALVAGSGRGLLRWIDWETGTVVRERAVFEESCGWVAACADGRVVAAGDMGVVLLGPDGNELARASTYKWPYGVSVTDDQRRALIATWDANVFEITLDAWHGEDDDDGASIDLGVPYPGMPFYAALEVDADHVVIGGSGELQDGNGASLALWKRGAKDWVQFHQTGGVLALALSPDRRLLAAAGYDGVRFYDPRTLTEHAHVDVEASYSWGATPLDSATAHPDEDLEKRLARLGLATTGLEGIDAPAPRKSAAVPSEAVPYSGAPSPHVVASIAWARPDRLLAGTFGGDVLEIRVS